MSSMYGTSKYVIEGENAAKVYAAIVDSFYYRNFSEYLKIEYKEGHLLIEEEWCDYLSLDDYILPFLIGNQYSKEIF